MIFDANNLLAPSSPVIPTSVGVAIVSGYILDVLKRLKQVPKINFYSTRINALLRVAMAGVGTLGVSYSWSPAGTGHQLLITIPAFAVLVAGVWHWVVQYGMQHGFESILQGARQLNNVSQQDNIPAKQ